ncbi:MAG TPA: tetratricopeptide repeat protein [Candidatus Polarisedimenticolaceae bacterium]|nr:tetratricopeptide repeat protein [Candidatus Polarisedimenticolaceae bacterium]
MRRTRSRIAAAILAAACTATLASADSWWTPRLREKHAAPSDQPAGSDEVPNNPAAPPPAPGAASAEAVAASILPTQSPGSSLHKLGQHLRQGPVGAEPNAVAYLDLIDAGKATAAQVNDFAAYLAKRGMPRVALAYQHYATDLAPKDPTIWLNLGTIQRTNHSLGDAAGSFKRAIALDPNNALAHYNLGAVYDAEKSYDDAIEEYRRALVLDPDLADPRKNPQVVNNENLMAVRLTIYANQAGALGLPLLQMQKPVDPKAAPAKPPAQAPKPPKQ